MRARRHSATNRLRRLVAATTISSLGDGVALVAFSLLAVKLTSHPVLIAGVAIADQLPWLLVALPAGAIVDRVDRRRLVVAVELTRAAVLGVFALGALEHVLDLPELYLAALLIGTGDTLVSAASRAAIPLLVTAEEVPAANGNVNAAQSFGLQFAGPALGGFVFSLAAALPFAGDAVSFVASAGILRTALPQTQSPMRTTLKVVTADVRSGLRFFLERRVLRILAGLVGSFAFCQAMVLSVLVIYATRVLGLGGAGYGLLLSVAASANIAASLLARRLHVRVGVFATLLIAGIGAAGGYLLLGTTVQRAVALFGLALEAAATSLGNVATMSLRHRTIPTERFGIVNNAIRMCIAGLVPCGALVGGEFTAHYGTRTTFVIAAMLQLAMLIALALPLRRAGVESAADREGGGLVRSVEGDV